MSATPTTFNPNKLEVGPGTAWKVDVPAVGAKLLLATDGTPDSTFNPKHLGHTEGGWVFKASASFDKYFVDEIADPVYQSRGDSSASLAATLMQGADVDLLVLLSPGQGTKTSGTGYEGVSGGSIPLVYYSVALIYPTIADPTKFVVIQLYKCVNTAGIEKTIQRKGLSKTPVTFEGVAVTSRPATDQVFHNWQQI